VAQEEIRTTKFIIHCKKGRRQLLGMVLSKISVGLDREKEAANSEFNA
jgi:hypothetical protein